MRGIIHGTAARTLTLAAASALFGCTAGANSTVSANAEVVNRGSQALSGSAEQWVNGTYGSGCDTNANGSWSLQIATGSVTMDNPPLSVVTNNTACVLTLTSVVTVESTKTTYTATPPVQLGGSYQGTPSTFTSASGETFYGNIMMSPSDFSSNLTVTFLYSDDPTLATGAPTGAYAAVAASSAAQGMTSPDYMLDLSSGALTVVTDVNANVESVTGTAILVAGNVTGNSYYVDQGTLFANPTFSQLDAAYSSATTTSISGSGNVTIAASAFGLSGTNLTSTVYRTIVVQRLVSGVASYEALPVAFRTP